MAQYLQDGGQQPQQYSYHSEWVGEQGSYGNPADNFHNQQTILDQSDNAMMAEFFSNPNTAIMDDHIFSASGWAGMDQKSVGDGLGGQLDGWDMDNHTIQNPAVTLAGTSHSNYQTHVNGQNSHTVPRTDFAGNFYGQSADDDDEERKAASGLFNMSMHGQDTSRATVVPNHSIGASWGTFGTNLPNVNMPETLQSPITSSGRQSVNSYPSSAQPSPLHHPHLQNNQLQPHMTPQHTWNQQISSAGHPRHHSLQLDTSNFDFFSQQQTQMQMARSANPLQRTQARPTTVRFGSDNNFSNRGYHAPTNGLPLEYEKGGNLNNVPFAAQVSANGQRHMPGFAPIGQQHMYQNYAMPSGSNNYHNTSTVSSPGNMGGLPMSSPMSNINRHSHPFHTMPTATAAAAADDNGAESEDDVEFEDPQPRKRRKSQMQADDDTEYSPAGHVKTPATKRGSKLIKTDVDGSDDDYEDTPPTGRSSAKRRKSSVVVRPSFGSSQSGSPQDMTSPTIRPASGSKKKNRNPQPRSNLTEEEKRRNHIQSEKTRRDLIRVQYDELDRIVPALKEGKSGLSRSDQIKEVVLYVEAVAGANKAMEARLGIDSSTATASGAGAEGKG